MLPSFAAAIGGPGGHPSTACRGTTAPRKAATPTSQYPSATFQLPRQGAVVATSMTSSSSGFARRHGGARGQLCTNAVLKLIHSHRRKARVSYDAMQQTSRRSSTSETLHLVAFLLRNWESLSVCTRSVIQYTHVSLKLRGLWQMGVLTVTVRRRR